MKLSEFAAALLTVGIPVNHYFAAKQPNQYIVWSEDSQSTELWADNAMQSQTVQGTVDYFTKIEYDANVEAIQTALTDTGINWRLNSVQYEPDTKFIHYEWIFEVDKWLE